MIFRIDTHVHSEKSFDSEQSLNIIAAEAKKKGIDGVCICDHNIPFVDSTVIDGVMIFGGIEISTEYGHVLGLFIKEHVGPIRSYDEAISRIKDAGGIAVLAHPYENGKISKEYLDERLDNLVYMLDGIEVVNSRATQYVKRANEYALEAAERNNRPRFAGSDAHLPSEVGSAYAELEVEEKSEEAVRAALLADTARIFTTGTVKRKNVIKSQYIKCKKSADRAKAYRKLVPRAIKGMAYELFRPEKRELREFK